MNVIDGTRPLPAVGDAMVEAERERKGAGLPMPRVGFSKNGSVSIWLPVELADMFSKGAELQFKGADDKVLVDLRMSDPHMPGKRIKTSKKRRTFDGHEFFSLGFGKQGDRLKRANIGDFTLTKAEGLITDDKSARIIIGGERQPALKRVFRAGGRGRSAARATSQSASIAPMAVAPMDLVPVGMNSLEEAVRVVNAYRAQLGNDMKIQLKAGGGIRVSINRVFE